MDVSKLKLADGVSTLGTEKAFEVLARARELERQGREIIHLELGEPDFTTPEHISVTACKAILMGETHYCNPAGIPELREAVSEYFYHTRDITVDPNHVLIANGARAFIFFTILATCNPGDEVIYQDPGYPLYESAIRWVRATPVSLKLKEENGFSMDVNELAKAITSRTKLIILNSPHNPTGVILNKHQISAIADAIQDYPIWVLADEIYSQLVYEKIFYSIASEPRLLNRTVLLDGFSKTFAMTGWRCGFAAVPSTLVEPLTKFFINSYACVPPFIQRAGVEALRGSQLCVKNMVDIFRARRDLMVNELNKIKGFYCPCPSGTFYTFPNIKETGWEAEMLASTMLDKIGVAVLAGTSFGEVAKNHLRFSYTNSENNIKKALNLLKDMLS